MPFLEWTDTFSIGVAELDQQHQHLLELLNKLHDASERSNSLATLKSVLNELEAVKCGVCELVAYASYHFETEEQYMVQHAYPEAEQHRREHQAFTVKTRVFQQDAIQQKRRLCPEIMAFCRDWWQVHVQGTDRRLGAFLVERGLK